MSSGDSSEWTDADVDAYLAPEYPSDTTCEHGLDYEHYLDPETDRRICHPPNCSACVPVVTEADRLRAELAAANERAGVAEQALADIAAHHERCDVAGNEHWCAACDVQWPCPTFTAANSVLAAGSTPTTTQETDNG